MTGPRRALGFTPMETRREVIVEMSQLADTLGYEAVQIPEGWGMDSTLVLAEVALTTERIRPMSTILSIWNRTPATIAMSTATLADMSDGRYVLGLGVSTPAIVEGFHDLTYMRPAGKLAAVVKKVRGLLEGERAELDRETSVRPLRLGQPPRPDQEIYLAGMGPRIKRVTAELADGWMPVFIARDQLRDRISEVLEQRRESGADPEKFTVTCGPMVAVDGDTDAARGVAASNLAFYICAMGDDYARLIGEQGFADEVAAVREANPKPSPGGCVIPEEAEALCDQFLVFGDHEAVAAALRKWDEATDVVVLLVPPGAPPAQLEAIVRAGSPKGS